MKKDKDLYRFQTGSLYKFDKASNAYIHCYRSVSANTKQKAIRAYENELMLEDEKQWTL